MANRTLTGATGDVLGAISETAHVFGNTIAMVGDIVSAGRHHTKAWDHDAKKNAIFASARRNQENLEYVKSLSKEDQESFLAYVAERMENYDK